MIKPLIIEQILIDIYHNGVFQFTVNQFTQLDIRKQIIKGQINGYTMKMNPQYYFLFDNEDNIEEIEIIIHSNGEISDWFPEYKINEEYESVGVFSECLSAVLKIRGAQKQIENK